MGLLLFAADMALDVQAPRVFALRTEAQHVIGYVQLGAPSFSIDCGLHRPHAVPGLVLVPVVGIDTVDDRTRGIDRKKTPGLAVEMRIETDRHPVGFCLAVAPRQPRYDACGIAVVTANADVESLFVVGDLHGCFFAGRFAFDRIQLEKVRSKRGLLPDSVVEATVDLGRLEVVRRDSQRCCSARCRCGVRGDSGWR